MVVPAAVNSENIVRLPCYDADGDSIRVTIASVPPTAATGTLYQLSQPFSAYGYAPKAGATVSSANTIVTGSGNRIVYSPPRNRKEPAASWGTFEYQCTDTSNTQSTKAGVVSLLAPGNKLVHTSYTFGSDAWAVTANGAGGVGISHSRSSRGLLNHYVFSKDDEINVNSAGDDTKLWYFVAPPAFLNPSPNAAPTNRHNLLAFGGSLSFTLSSQAGDFSPGNLNSNLNLVVLECATCNGGHGIRLLRPLNSPLASPLTWDGKEKKFTIPFTTSGGTGGVSKVHWLKDSRHAHVQHAETNDCELIEVLNGLSAMKILGDFTRWHESVSLDDVYFSAGHPVRTPLSCYPIGQ
jgi:hypothetical protein